MLKTAFVGEAMIELVTTPEAPAQAALNVAGDVFNTATYFKRIMGDAAEVGFVTALGDDSFSGRIASACAGEGMTPSAIRTVPGGQCGMYAVETDASGERSFAYWRSTAAARSLFTDPADFAACEGGDLVFLSGITLAIISDEARASLLDWLKSARANGLKLAFDSNYRPRLWSNREVAAHWMDAFWRASDIAFPSVDDEGALTGEDADTILARFESYGVTSGALKMGGDGAITLGATREQVRPTRVSNVVDTTAAGDSFNAAFLGSYLQGASTAEATAAGHALAGRVVEHRGAIIDL